MEKNFKQFIENVKLTDPQINDAKAKAGNVCGILHRAFYSSKYNGQSRIYIGSYGKKTNVSPVRDVDVIFKIPEEIYNQYDEIEGNGQSQLMQKIKGLLADKYGVKEKPKARGCVVVVDTADWTHNVELLPAFKKKDGTYHIPNTKDGGSWKDVDPVSEQKNVSDSNTNTSGYTRDLVRMMKKWVEESKAKIKSFQVELLVVNFLEDYEVTTYAFLVRDFLEYISTECANTTLIMPGTGESISLGEEWLSRSETALGRAEKAIKFEEDGKYHKAYKKWEFIFGSKFPSLGAKNENFIKATKEQYDEWAKLFPSNDEEYLDTKYGIRFDELSLHELVIDGSYSVVGSFIKSFRKASLSYFSIGKKVSFRVDTDKSSLPEGCVFKWKVRNFGVDAQEKGALRGEIKDGAGHNGSTMHDFSAFSGTHCVICYAIKNNVCLATDILFVPIK